MYHAIENPKLQPDSPAQSDHLGFSFYMLWRSSGPIYSKIGGGVTGPSVDCRITE